jgi:transposase
MSHDHGFHSSNTIRTDLAAIFVSLELSRRNWLITSLSPGKGETMSRHSVKAGALSELLRRLADLRGKAKARTGGDFPIVVIMEAGLDGFWLYRALVGEGVESHVVDAGSIAVPRRRRRAKSDRIDGECLLRVLMAYKRGEPRVCSMVRPPSVQEEDRRRVTRERKSLVGERTEHTNRIKGLLFAQGIGDYEPIRRDRRQELEALRTGDGRPLPDHLKRQISRELDRLEMLIEQIKAVEAERDALLADHTQGALPPGARVTALKGIGPEFGAVLGGEVFYRTFDNRRQIGSYAGLSPTPWRSGGIDKEQGISKAGNRRLRTTLIQIAWLWLRHQPTSELTLWFNERVKQEASRGRRVKIVALARKLLIALWKFEVHGEIPKGAVLKAA